MASAMCIARPKHIRYMSHKYCSECVQFCSSERTSSPFFVSFISLVVFAICYGLLISVTESFSMWDPWSDPWTDTMLPDPPLAATQPVQSSDEEDVPPPSAHTGLSRQVAHTMTVQQLAESLFSPGIAEPGLLRILNNAGEVVHKATVVGHLSPPRMVYCQTGSWSHFQHMQHILEDSSHDDVLTRADEARLQLVSLRIFSSYVPVFRALEQTQRIISMQTVVNDNLENRIKDLETAVAQQQRQIAELLARTPAPVEPETEVEPLRADPPLEEY